MLPLWAKVDLGVIAMKVYSAFPKAPAHILDTCLVRKSYPSEEMQVFFSMIQICEMLLVFNNFMAIKIRPSIIYYTTILERGRPVA